MHEKNNSSKEETWGMAYFVNEKKSHNKNIGEDWSDLKNEISLIIK